MIDLLLPTSDRVALIQAGVVTLGGGVALFFVRHHREARLLVAGVWILTLALIAVRALH